MIRLKAFLISIVLVLITLVILDKTYVKKIENYYKVKDNSVRYSTAYEKYKSKDIITENITPNTLVLLGSSELTATINENYHPKKIFNYNDFNIMQIGTGYSQNIVQASTLGSIEGAIKNRKVAIVESVQWFAKGGLQKDAFLNKASQEHIYNTMINNKISKETKEKLINRVIELTGDNKGQNDIYRKYKEYFIENKGSFIDGEMLKIENYIYSFKNKTQFYSNKGKIDYPLSGQNTPNYDWDSLTNDFVEKIKKTTNNNEYAVDNKYYNTYLAKNYSSFRDSNKGTSYLESPEYIDYEIFLDVAKELGMEVEVIIFPVNGKWNDYTGVSKEMREQTYRNIEEIAKKYTNVKVLNYGNREYDDYFLFDVMHVGVKGWMQVERELYEFAKQN
ncbi:D-alanyl-lipoteichoic acid biosynthesis protein DltD [Gemella parahaemolysans]|jgi:D-alanyl-lipoteichoic acid biosynthesis protein dltD